MPQDAYLYHATPLHYLPHILTDGALYAQSILAAKQIKPRTTAARRARMLGLTDWVHLGLQSHSPLLADKLRQGYPHALLVFHRAPVLALPETALLPYNLKAWRTRAHCQPITDSVEKDHLLRCHTETKRYPSLEVLAHYGLSLAPLSHIAFSTDHEREMTLSLCRSLDISRPAPLVTDFSLVPSQRLDTVTTLDAITVYFDACILAKALLPPPAIPFD